jgi:PhoH-like ATPase
VDKLDRIGGPVVANMHINQFVYFESPGEPSLYARVTEIRGKTAVMKTLKDFSHIKNAVWGVTSRNREQNFALNMLMDPDIDFVTLTGTAGTGKTLLALATGLLQVLDDRRYTEIIVTRATVSVGEDIGFLPGTEEEKMGPWMGALDDNLEVLGKTDTSAGEWGRAATNELIRSKIKIKSLNFMRGRTFLNKFVIIDEAQNLTPKQMKTLITRAGPGTKIVCMGNIAQIDTPYLTEGSSGLTFAVDRFKGWPHGGHITLARGERSRLADFASEVL